MSDYSKNTRKWPSNRKTKIRWLLKRLISNLVIWNILVRLVISMNLLVNPNFIQEGAKFFQILSKNELLQTGIISFVIFCSWLLEDVFFFKFLTKKSLGGLFFFRILFLMIILFLTFMVIPIFRYKSTLTLNLQEYFQLIKDFVINRTSAYLFVTTILIATMINFFKSIQQKVGSEKFWPYVTGRFRKPKEENRIFAFIDLTSSTKYAELLGHKKYSLFLRECFKYLGFLEIKYRAMHYQFVGDEVVLSWSAKKRNYLYAVQFYYEYMSILNSKASYFSKEFGVVPQFTASVNCGNIMISEVGTIKSEIAFHGDVLNTAARIQKKCKSYNKQLLVTHDFANKFKKANPDKDVTWVGENILSGKKEMVKIYTIEL